MTLAEINSKISFLTKSNTTNYSPANRALNINNWNSRVTALILRSQDSWDFDDSNRSDFPILTTDLVAGQQDYALPLGSLQIKRGEVTYDGSSWNRLNPFDINEREGATNSASLADFTTSKPFYDIHSGSLFLYPIPTGNVSAALTLWIARAPVEFTADQMTSSDEPGFDSLFHEILAYGAAYEYATANSLANREILKRTLDEMQAELRAYYGSKDKDIIYSFQGENNSFK
jgi:hypothetical protein